MKPQKQNFVKEFIQDFSPAIRLLVVITLISILAAASSLFIGVAMNWGHIHF